MLNRSVRALLLILALLITAALVVLAGVLVTFALIITRLARWTLGDRLTWHGNRLYRLGQRLSDALERLDAAVQICVKG